MFQLHPKYKLALAIFTASFSFFLVFVLIDDLFLGDVNRIEFRKFLWIRLLAGFAFSILLGGLTFYFVNLIYRSLKSLAHLFRAWSAEQDPEEEFGITGGNDEIGELSRSFRLALFQRSEEEVSEQTESKLHQEKEYANKLQSLFFKIKLHKIRNLDITVFPRSSENGETDYANIIPTADGCMGILAGFPNSGYIEAGLKARIEGMVSLAQEMTGVRGEDLVYKLDRSIRSTPISGLNLTLFYLETRNGELGYLQYQETPILIYKNARISEQEVSKHRFYDFQSAGKEIRKLNLKPNEYFILVSDRVPEIWNNNIAISLQKIKTWSEGKDYKNSREVVLDLARCLESEVGRSEMSKAAILCVQRVRNS
ncbi:Arg-Lys translocation region protein phosphatase [Leptospira perolatii]|uniref:Arg-Lys translocation region protein phosphatase n=1 Tax=Leptospira perolatii TaxID=2023191 RepID=A0A2M9ZMF8_9LEPT|nr:Arg-Lys translocation region protein phosphatase RktP [Leptospira perolatii]PJZ70074.1 Arg-Lys translocation region protein phosphatase [Leptospira perolatii]PJZ73262.1 Arg-Lys translocation region protein phosphatase [Leptospira perolatii]